MNWQTQHNNCFNYELRRNSEGFEKPQIERASREAVNDL